MFVLVGFVLVCLSVNAERIGAEDSESSFSLDSSTVIDALYQQRETLISEIRDLDPGWIDPSNQEDKEEQFMSLVSHQRLSTSQHGVTTQVFGLAVPFLEAIPLDKMGRLKARTAHVSHGGRVLHVGARFHSTYVDHLNVEAVHSVTFFPLPTMDNSASGIEQTRSTEAKAKKDEAARLRGEKVQKAGPKRLKAESILALEQEVAFLSS